MRFLVTAGNTRERIDDVRDWGNIFTGNTGLSIARAMAGLGEVDLLTSNLSHLAELPPGIQGTPFRSHADLKAALSALVPRIGYDAIFMTAAVADYRPIRVFSIRHRWRDLDSEGMEHWLVEDVQAGKVKSNHPAIAVLGEQTEKIVDLFRKEWGYKGLLFKFKLEVGISKERLVEVAEESRKASGADYLVANSLDMVEGEGAGAFLLSDSGREWVGRGNLPGRLAEIVRLRYAV